VENIDESVLKPALLLCDASSVRMIQGKPGTYLVIFYMGNLMKLHYKIIETVLDTSR
jgi:hypothetical protein